MNKIDKVEGMYAVVYTAIAVALLDAAWLTFRYNYHNDLFKSIQKSKLVPRLVPAALIYLLIPTAVYLWAIRGKKTIQDAILNGLLVGFILYAFYDLTNYATLTAWTLEMTTIDILWGMTVCAVGAGVGFYFENN